MPYDIREIFVTTHDIGYEWHVKIQAAAQKYTDSAVSKTINMSHDATIDQVKSAYIMAYELRCKGITVYRDGSKQGQILNTSHEEKKTTKTLEEKINTTKEPETKNIQNSLTKNALSVLEKRVLLKDENNNVIETPQDLWKRIACHVASTGIHYKETQEEITKNENMFFEIMNNGEFMCGGSLIWAGMSGKDAKRAMWSKCFVLPIEDSINSIFKTLNHNIEVLRRGGGTGFNFSHIRSTYAKVKTTNEKASGPIEYLKVYNTAQDTILGRGGRQMGSMAILNIDHPDIERFIECKDENGVLNHYNISVGITDSFMEAVEKNSDWDLIDPHDKKVYKTIKARDLFDKIAKHAWESGDPGVIFVDKIQKHNPMPGLGTIEATNPCGEQPLLAYESCNLGSINISKMIEGFPYLEKGKGFYSVSLEEKLKLINWTRLEEVVKAGVIFLDNVIDTNYYPIKEIEDRTKSTRPLGLGVMGFANLLIKLGISYNSSEAIKVIDYIMGYIQTKAKEVSISLAKKRGVFSAINKSVWHNKEKIRNSRLISIAPTGTTSIIANCSAGIEPIFALVYKMSNIMGKESQLVIDSFFKEIAQARGFYSQELMDKIAEGESIKNLKEIPEDVKQVFITSHDIPSDMQIKVQAEFQKYVDSAVSKTINLERTATVEEIKEIYRLAYNLNTKGVTIYRDGCKDEQVLTKGNIDNKDNKDITKNKTGKKEEESIFGVTREPKERPHVVSGSTYSIKTGYGKMFVIINSDNEGRPFEVFSIIGKAGGVFAAKAEAICRLISLALRSGISVDIVISQIKGIRGPMPSWHKGKMILSIPDAIAQVLVQHINKHQQKLNLQFSNKKEKEVKEDNKTDILLKEKKELNIVQTLSFDKTKEDKILAVSNSSKSELVKSSVTPSIADTGMVPECPDCGNIIEFVEGCLMCRACGYSKCG